MAEPVHIHRLVGCTPTPLASYLKALAVLRLLSSPTASVRGRPADPDARGWWQDEGFHLRTRLDRDALLRFFLEDYAPSPIIAPWNGGSGFFFREGKTNEIDPETGKRVKTGVRDAPTEATRRLDRLAGAQAPRLAALAGAIACAREILEEMGLQQAPTDVQKPALMTLLRSRAAEPVADWMDAAMTVLDTRFEASALLGSGGNDGNLDFSTTFHGAVLRLIDPGSGQIGEDAEAALACALFDTPMLNAGQAGISQLAPGRMEAVNHGTGFNGDAPETVWSVVLMFEGALTFAGTATRRGEAQRARASFPFTVQQTAAGSGAVAGENDTSSRPFELWLPLWTRPIRHDEAQALFGEGRAHVGRAAAGDGLSFARAVSRLGVSRGITELVRLGFEPRNGNMFLSVPLGRFRTPKAPRDDLVADLVWGGWLSRLRRLAGRSEAPERLRLCLRRLDDALIAMTRADGRTAATAQALIALGEVVAWVACSRAAKETLPPPPRLSDSWIYAADDRTAEFRVAEALASLGWSAAGMERAAVDQDDDEHVEPPDGENPLPQADPIARDTVDPEATNQGRPRIVPAMAVHFASVEPDSVTERQRRWTDSGSRSVVWGGGGLVANMVAVLERRLIEHAAAHFTDKGLGGCRTARLEDIAAFLAGPPAFDDARCAALLAGMVWAQPRKAPPREASKARADGGERTAGPFAYAAMKPIFAPDALLHDLQALPAGRSLPIPPGLVTLLRRGDTDTAIRRALARARASGLPSPFDPARTRAGATSYGAGLVGARLAAALLIPVAEDDLKAALRRAYPDALPTTKETDDAA